MYGAESWTLTAKVKSKLEVFDNECIRTILGIEWNDRIRNEELRGRSREEALSEKAASRIIRWASHVCRINYNRIAR